MLAVGCSFNLVHRPKSLIKLIVKRRCFNRLVVMKHQSLLRSTPGCIIFTLCVSLYLPNNTRYNMWVYLETLRSPHYAPNLRIFHFRCGAPSSCALPLLLWCYGHGVLLCYMLWKTNPFAAGWAGKAVLHFYISFFHVLALGDAGERKPVWLLTFLNWTMPHMETRVFLFLGFLYRDRLFLFPFAVTVERKSTIMIRIYVFRVAQFLGGEPHWSFVIRTS